MFTAVIENLIILLLNHFTHTKPGPAPARSRGIIARLLGRPPSPAPAATSPPTADPPVVIGTIIPSAREALRQGKAPPLPVSLTTETRSKHIYCVGKSGMGKTAFNVGLIDADIAARRAVVLLDYRGDLLDRVCQRIAAKYSPEEMADRLLLFDLRSPLGASTGNGGYTVGFNPLAQCGRTAYARGLFTFDAFDQHFRGALGVQTSETLQNSLLALALTGGTLLDVEPLLTSEAFRTQTLARIDDSTIRRFFARLEALPEAQRALWVNPIQNKLAPFTINPVLRTLLGDTQSVSIQEFLDRRSDGIVLFCAGADEHFGSTAIMLSNLFVNAVAAAVMRTDRASRHSVLFYADEFQNLCGSDKFSEIISEGRRFGLWLTLSHQSPSQLEPKIRTLVRNVVSTSLLFGLGGADSEILAGEISSDEPKTVLRNLLLNQHVGEAVLLRQGMPAVRIKTRYAPDPDVSPLAVHALRQASLRRHGRPSAEVVAELRAREALFLPELPPARRPVAQGFGQPSEPSAQPDRAASRQPFKKKPSAIRHCDEEEYEVRESDE